MGTPLDKLDTLDRPNSGSETGRDAETPMDMPAMGWRQVLLRAWRRSWDNNIGLVAAGTAFYGFVAIVPMMLASLLLYSFLADPDSIVRSARSLELVMPAGAAEAITDQMERLVNASQRTRGIGILGALAVALFGARNAATALIAALNVAYGEEEKRSIRRLSLVALAITLSGFLLAFSILVGMTLVASLRDLVPSRSDIGYFAIRLIAALVLVCLSGLGAAALYRFAPCRTKPRWEWTAPGSLLAALSWTVLTIGFSLYVRRFGTFSDNYGPSAAGVVLLVWLYLTGVVFLFCAQINAELERQTVEDTTDGGDKPMGTRGAEAADEVAKSSDPDDGSSGGG